MPLSRPVVVDVTAVLDFSVAAVVNAKVILLLLLLLLLVVVRVF